jgi:amidohydrolase
MPHFGADPVVGASHIVTALQTIASRNVSPLDSVVVTIAMIQAGSASNIIPESATLTGTLRTLRSETRTFAQERIGEIAMGIATSLGLKAELIWMPGYPVTFNDAGATAHFRNVIKPLFGENLIDAELEPTMGAEDFSFYGLEIPACFYWLGLLNEGQGRYPNLHAADFDFNDAAIPVGIRAMCALALA